MIKDVEEWISKSRALAEKLGIKAATIVNADESRCEPKSSPIRTLESAWSKKPALVKTSMRRAATVVPFVSGAGEVILYVYVFPAPVDADGSAHASVGLAKQTHNVPRTRSHPGGPAAPIYLLFTESGYLSGREWEQCVQVFAAEWRQQKGETDCMLLLDNCKIHKSQQLIDLSAKEGIHTLFLPPSTTDKIQPLDQAVFANYKRWVAQLTHEAQVADNYLNGSPGISPTGRLPILLQAGEKAFTKRAIQAAWRQTGITDAAGNVVFSAAMVDRVRDCVQREIDVTERYDSPFMRSVREDLQQRIQGDSTAATTTEVVFATVPLGQVRTPDQFYSHGITKRQRDEQRVQEAERRDEDTHKRRRMCVELVHTPNRPTTKCLVCAKAHARSHNWRICPGCRKVALCDQHSRSAANRTQLAQHELECVAST